MAKIKLFKNGSYLNRFQVTVPDEPDAATLYAIYRYKGGIRNFIRFVLADCPKTNEKHGIAPQDMV